LQRVCPAGTLPFSSIYSHATNTELLKLVSYALLFLVVIHCIRSFQSIQRIISVIIGIGFITSIFSLMRYFGAPAPRAIINPDHFAGFLGMIIPVSIGFFLPKIHPRRIPALS
jgi:hypothetical protein